MNFPLLITRALFAGAIILLAGAAGCGRGHQRSEPSPIDLPPARVELQVLEERTVALLEEVPGTVRGKAHASLEAKAMARLAKVTVGLGERVSKGEVLALLDAPEISARLDQATAAAQQSAREWKRATGLFEQQSLTQAEYDAARARQESALAALSEAQAMAGYLQVRAPFDGFITRKWLQEGDLAAPGKPLLQLEASTPLEVEADLPESLALLIKAGDRVTVKTAPDGSELEGVLLEISPATDPASRTVSVKASLPGNSRLAPGQFVRLALPAGQRRTLLAPASAILQRGQLDIAFVVTNKHAWMRLVRTGRRFGDSVEILSGLKSGEAIVRTGLEGIAEGQPVEVQ